MSGNQRAGRTPVCTVFYLGNGCADAGPLLPRYGYACRKSVQGGLNGRLARFCDHLRVDSLILLYDASTVLACCFP